MVGKKVSSLQTRYVIAPVHVTANDRLAFFGAGLRPGFGPGFLPGPLLPRAASALLRLAICLWWTLIAWLCCATSARIA